MPRRHINGRRALLQFVTFIALCGVAALAIYMATGEPRSRVHLGPGTPRPAEVRQSQPLAVGVDSKTGDMSVISRGANGEVQQVTIPSAELEKAQTSPLSEGTSASPPSSASGG